MTKQFDFEINRKQTLILKVQLCEPYPIGGVSAYAQPVLTKSFRFYYGPPGTSASPQASVLYEADTALRTLLVRNADGSVSLPSDRLPVVPPTDLQTSFDTSSGLITVLFPFGITYREPPYFEMDLNASPRRYFYSVSLGQQKLAYGFVRMSPSLASNDNSDTPAACAISSEYESAGGATPEQSGGPWLAGV